MQIREAHEGAGLRDARRLFEEYAASLGICLDFQDFDSELAGLPGGYAPPEGCLLVAYRSEEAAGCIARRKLGDGICELKRLYVKPRFRCQGIGRALAEDVIRRARGAGCVRMRLDTLPSMQRARALYDGFGFREIGPYCNNPVAGATYLELVL